MGDIYVSIRLSENEIDNLKRQNIQFRFMIIDSKGIAKDGDTNKTNQNFVTR